MNKTSVISTLAMAALLVPALAFGNSWNSDPLIAGEGCDNLEYTEIGVFLGKYYTATDAMEDRAASSEALLVNYAIASALVNRAQICLAEALDLKKLADKLRKQQAAITSGTSMSKRQVKKQRKLTSEANAEIEKTATQLEELTPEQRERFSKGTATYLGGTYATGQTFKAIGGFLADTANAATGQSKSRFGSLPGIGGLAKVADGAKSAMALGKGVSALGVGLKDHTVELYNTSKFLRDYSAKNDVDVPADATSDLAAVEDWI